MTNNRLRTAVIAEYIAIPILVIAGVASRSGDCGTWLGIHIAFLAFIIASIATGLMVILARNASPGSRILLAGAILPFAWLVAGASVGLSHLYCYWSL